MTNLVTWLPLIPWALVFVFFWWWTSYSWIRLLRVPPVVALAVAPAVTSFLVLPLSVLWYRAGWFWSGVTVLPVLAGIGGLGWWVFRRWGSTLLPPPPGLDAGRVTGGKPSRFVYSWRGFPGGFFVLAVSLGWLLAMFPSFWAGRAGDPVQQWDPSFHMNGVWGITKLGIAAPQVGLAHNYGGAPNSDYPVGWHAFTSLFTTSETTILAANASSLALMLVWVVGAGVYAWLLYPDRTVAVAAPIVAGLLPSMPADALTMYSQWPNAMSVAFLPGVAGVAIFGGRGLLAFFRPVAQRGAGNVVGTGVVTVAGLVGGIQAHQVFAFNLLVLLLPAVLAGLGYLLLLAWRGRSLRLGLLVSAAGGALAFSVVYVSLTPQLASMRSYPRDGVSWSVGLASFFLPSPPFPDQFGLVLLMAAVMLLAVVGTVAVVLVRWGGRSWARWPGLRRPLIWPVFSFLGFALLTFAAYGPEWFGRRWLVGPWFNDGRRIMEPESLALVPLVAVGFAWLVLWGVRLWNRSLEPGSSVQFHVVGWALAGWLLLGTLGGAFASKVGAAREVLDPDVLGASGMADRQVLDMFRDLPELAEPGAVVIGDPQAGGVYSQMLGQRWAYFPQLSLLNEDEETQQTLAYHFKDLHTDPAVCAAIDKAGITHFFEAEDGQYYATTRSERLPGLYGVDTSEGFELVAEAGEARIYLITACD